MVVEEYLEMVRDSLEPIKPLLPPGSKLLFESLVDDTMLLESMANNMQDGEEPIINDILIMQGIKKSLEDGNVGLYNECFMLVTLSGDDGSEYTPLKRELVIPRPELEDLDPVERLIALENWLMSDDEEGEYFCDSFFEDIAENGMRVYAPNRIPEKYDSTPRVTFVSIF